MQKHDDTHQPVVPLDQTSDRYRICPHPNCKKAHMVKNRGRDYCCDQHADDHYNMQRRLKNQVEMGKAFKLLLPLDETHLNVANSSAIDGTVATSSIDKNQQILDSLSVDAKEGTHFFIDVLLASRFDFKMCVPVSISFNAPKGLDCRYLNCGNYQIYLIEPAIILIKRTNKIK